LEERVEIMNSRSAKFDDLGSAGSAPANEASGTRPSPTARGRSGPAGARTNSPGAGAHRLETFLTVDEVAGALAVSTRTVRRWIAAGELVVHRFGDAVRIAESDLRTFIQAHRGD
jgi:excisionase family DNA binding protein